jgi:uncharacterized protein YidB (DUF937 family)
MNWFKSFFGERAQSSDPIQTMKAAEARVLGLLNDFFVSNGGLARVVKRFEESGFQSKVRSWVSTGANQPINSVEVLQFFGSRNLSDMARKAEVSVEKLRDLLAELLPVAIDRATPQGKL